MDEYLSQVITDLRDLNTSLKKLHPFTKPVGRGCTNQNFFVYFCDSGTKNDNQSHEYNCKKSHYKYFVKVLTENTQLCVDRLLSMRVANVCSFHKLTPKHYVINRRYFISQYVTNADCKGSFLFFL